MTTAALPRSGCRTQQPPGLSPSIVSIATFMEVLDTTIANVALRHIAGSLGASQDESTYIVTSYLVSNAIIIHDQRLAEQCDRAQALLHDLRRAIHGQPRSPAASRQV